MTEDEDFASLLAEYEVANKGPEIGERVRGRVVSIGNDNVFVDLGGKAEGSLELEQVTDANGVVRVAVGDTLEARVVAIDDRTGLVVLRSSLGKGSEARAELEDAYKHGIPVEGLVTEVNKGGVEVQIAGTRAFCPISQLDLRFVEDAAAHVGKRYQFRITRYEGGKRPNIVVSRKALLEEEAAERAHATRAKLEVGAVLPGTVTSLKDYGAFVDLGGLEGMIHISELGFQRVGHPSEVLGVGQAIEAQVLKIEPGKAGKPEKIALSLRSLERDPWSDVADRYPEGTVAHGEVVRTEPFGAFVALAPGVEGLVHISELGAGRRVNHPREVVQLGQRVEVRVLGVDAGRRRLSLSMAPLVSEEQAAETAAVASYQPPTEGLGTFADLFNKNKRGK